MSRIDGRDAVLLVVVVGATFFRDDDEGIAVKKFFRSILFEYIQKETKNKPRSSRRRGSSDGINNRSHWSTGTRQSEMRVEVAARKNLFSFKSECIFLSFKINIREDKLKEDHKKKHSKKTKFMFKVLVR